MFMITDLELYRRALAAAGHAYAPYSRYHVGAAALTADGRVFEGANIENASYGATICAERVAAAKAVFDGYDHQDLIIAIAIAAYAENGEAETPYPCGICRQFLSEFGSDIRVITGKDEDHLETYALSELLPKAFTSVV
jgi:cytidine deaminase